MQAPIDNGSLSPDTASLALARSLFSIVPQLFHAFRPRHVDAGPDGQAADVRGQVRMLGILARSGPMKMNDLARRMDVTPPTMTGIVKRSLPQGAIQRHSDPDDGRTTWVEITDQGRTHLAETLKRGTIGVAERLAVLPAEDIELIRAALPALRRLAGPPCQAKPTDTREKPQ